ncbi:MAG: zinc ribbon domain-containing protein [Candidatus Thermoplasmatota archaeon]|nr:zinc ribbon domain-containing protein [Candidatus Thermoplasmatota archaeon]
MGGVYCPKCEAEVDAVAKFCLACGHSFLNGEGPITSTGHDLNELKEAIKVREDISMAEKFNLMAQIEEGANPIRLGIAAPAEDDSSYEGLPYLEDQEKSDEEEISVNLMKFGDSAASNYAVNTVVGSSEAWDLVKSGKIDFSDKLYRESMTLGIDASKHIHDISTGEFEGVDADVIKEIPVLKPPKRSFCPKCGTDIHSFTMMQWRKWRDASSDVVGIQLEAAMETSIVKVSAHHINEMEDLKIDNSKLKAEIDDLKEQLENTDKKSIEAKLRKSLTTKIRKELLKELKSGKDSIEEKAESEEELDGDYEEDSEDTETTQSPAKKKAKSLFGPGKKSKSFDGKKSEKPEWFLNEALDTVYDPHGTGKKLKRRTILARSSKGNVRVEDVVFDYAKSGEKGISELAWTSPTTKYIIEAYDSC